MGIARFNTSLILAPIPTSVRISSINWSWVNFLTLFFSWTLTPQAILYHRHIVHIKYLFEDGYFIIYDIVQFIKKNQVIYIHRHNCLPFIKHTFVNDQPFSSHTYKVFSCKDVKLPSSLFLPIYVLVQSQHLVRTKFGFHSLWQLHIDVILDWGFQIS